MIKGYGYCDFGLLMQVNPKPFYYNKEYLKAIKERGELNNYMAHLRYGYMIGVLGEIPESLLDVGYGDGSFLNVCKKKIRCYGNEISNGLIPDGCWPVKDITDYYYEIVCFHDSLEHMSDIEIIGRLRCKFVYISLPNLKAGSDEEFEKWKHRKPDEHLFHFNIKSLNEFMEHYNFYLLQHSYVEDVIRGGDKNILTAIYAKNS